MAKVVHKAGRWCMLGRGSANLDGGMEEGSRETSELAAAGGREHGAANRPDAIVQNVWAVRVIWLQTNCTAFRSENAKRLGQTFCKQNVWRDVECKLAFFDKKPNKRHEAFCLCARYRR